MKLVFDASELTPVSAKSVGIYRYAIGLFTEIARQCPSHSQLVLLCNGDNVADFTRDLPSARSQVLVLRSRMPGHLWRQWWMRLGCAIQMRQLGADVYLSPKGFVPRNLAWPRGVPRVAVLHDLIPFWYFERMPGHFGRLETWLVSDAFKHAFRHADRLIAISRDTADALIHRGVAQDRVTVVLNGVDVAAASQPRSELPPGVQGRFIFGMASALPHKNLVGVLAAYDAYRKLAGAEALPLVLCGATQVRQQGVLPVGRVSEAALSALYQHADAFLFLSLTEGFGYPPIEALRAGTPVVCSDLAVLREVTGDLARHVPPQSATLCGQALFEVCAAPWSTSQREALRASAQARISAELSWATCAKGVLSVLNEAGSAARLPGRDRE